MSFLDEWMVWRKRSWTVHTIPIRSSGIQYGCQARVVIKENANTGLKISNLAFFDGLVCRAFNVSSLETVFAMISIQCQIIEYMRHDGWSFHCKGVWRDPGQVMEKRPFVTVVGSSNYSTFVALARSRHVTVITKSLIVIFSLQVCVL